MNTLARLMVWVLLSVTGALAHANGDATHIVKNAMVAPGTCAESRPGTPTQLPDDWVREGRQTPATYCYRLTLNLAQKPQAPWALRMNQLTGNHRVTLNGSPVSSRHMQDAEITSVALLPYLFELPSYLLHTGQNELAIDVRMNPYRKQGISPAQFGPLSEMRDAFDRHVLLTTQVPLVLNVSVAAMAIFVLAAGRVRPKEELFGYFGWMMLLMCGRNTLYFVETLDFPPQLVSWLLFASQAITAYFQAMFGLVYSNTRTTSIKKPLMWGCILVPVMALLLIGSPYMSLLRLITYPLMMIGGIFVVYKIIQTAWTRHWLEATAMTIGPLGTLVAMSYDYLIFLHHLDITHHFWTPYFSPIIFWGFALTLLYKAMDAMNVAERMNITLEERVAERTRALESANQSKTRFLAAASHDLRQPTAAIGLLASLLRKQATDPEVKELTHMLDEAVSSMESLLVGLLDISKLDAGAVKAEYQSVCLSEVFQAVKVHETSAATAKGLRLRFRLPKSTNGQQLTVLTDPMLLHSVLRNLVANAIRYTESGGVLVAARRKGKHRIRLEVWDTGIGIAPEQQNRVFDEFYQVGNPARDRSRGVGLGLAIVRRTASLLGEKINLRSVHGKGSVFSIELPLNLAPKAAQPVKAAVAHPLTGRVIWLVEDDMLLRRALGEMLHSWGAHVRTWPDAESLLDELPHLLANTDDEEMPDTLISDYRLPGLDGVQLSQYVSLQFRTQGHTLKTLLISGDTSPSELTRFSESGMVVLSKPFRSERLLETIQLRRTEAVAA